MNLWVDAQISPAFARWLSAEFSIQATAIRDLNLRAADAIVLTKDADFVQLLDRHGAPPKVLWLTCGNSSNAHLKRLFRTAFPRARECLDRGDVLVEITGA